MLEYKDDHFLTENYKDSAKKLNLGRKKHFTIVEGIMLFKIIVQNHVDNLNKLIFWQNIETNQLLPERTAEQMKKFWHKNENNTVEQWLV